MAKVTEPVNRREPRLPSLLLFAVSVRSRLGPGVLLSPWLRRLLRVLCFQLRQILPKLSNFADQLIDLSPQRQRIIRDQVHLLFLECQSFELPSEKTDHPRSQQ